jgi:RimJ/RimL family protein N-acetyltransferase
MNDDIFRGERVRLATIEPEKDAKLMSAWQRDSEYSRLLDSDPARLWSAGQTKEWLEKQQEGDSFEGIVFMIRTIDENKAIGFVELDGISFHNGNSWIGIGIGERGYWGKGIGTEVMRIIARYAFEELGLYRLTLNVFAYNTRAIRAYEKVGFVIEGRAAEVLHREGRRWDIVYMGLLREDWLANKQK